MNRHHATTATMMPSTTLSTNKIGSVNHIGNLEKSSRVLTKLCGNPDAFFAGDTTSAGTNPRFTTGLVIFGGAGDLLKDFTKTPHRMAAQ